MDGSADTITDGRRVTQELAEWVADLNSDAVPDEVLEDAARSFVDFLGECLFVGATKPWGQSIASFCAHDGGGQPEATIIATGERTLASRAALANGTMALGFEFADFGSGSRPYPFAVTAPLAFAESRHRSGAGSRPGHRHRLRGHGPGIRCHLHQGFTHSLLRPIGLRHDRRGGRLCSAARTVGHSDEPTPSGSAARSPAARFRVTRKAPGSAHSMGAWRVSAPSPRRCWPRSGFRATELGLEGVQGFAQMYTGGHLDAAALVRWPRGFVAHHRPLDQALPDEHDAARSG